MSTDSIISPTSSKEITSSLNSVLQSVSDKEKVVICSRIWLNWEKKTLQEIGNNFKPNITRERVRQIEASGIEKIGRVIKSSNLWVFQDKAVEILKTHWGVLTKDNLINAIIKENNIDSRLNPSILEIIVQAEKTINKSKPKLGYRTYFYLEDINTKFITEIHKESVKALKKKKDVIEDRLLFSIVYRNLQQTHANLDFILVNSVWDIFEDVVKGEWNLVWLTKWKILNPKTLKDKAIYVMKKEKIPMHFIDISNKITEYLWDKVKVSTIHNELIRNNDFVLIGRWIYALKEWGFKSGTVLDVIIDVMKETDEAMKTEDIISNVLKVRNVKNATIYMNLQNKKYIERVWRNYYQLKK